MSNKTGFKCCKNKQFLHYICIKCHGIYHKCCLPKHKSKIKFIEENRLVCCDEIGSFSENNERSLLEKTISDLAEDSELKDKYILKIKAEHKEFLEEVTRREEELIEQLQQQEKKISELNIYITELKKSIKSNYMTNTANMQTINFCNTKNCSTSSDRTMQNVNFLLNNKKQAASKISKAKESQKVNDKAQTQTNLVSQIHANHLSKIDKSKKNKILILSDQNNISWQMRKLLDLQQYEIMSIKNPGALLCQIIENIESLTKNYTLQDFVIIIGGANDIKNRRTPLFRSICNKLKMCSHTNILFVSVPYVEKNQNINRHIYKFNTKLSDFLHKFNNYTEGVIKYIESNNDHSKKFHKDLVATQILHAISLTKNVTKNLKFIKISDSLNYDSPRVSLSTEKAAPITRTISPSNLVDPPRGDPDIIIIEETPSTDFLYPRLSEIIFQN